MEKVLNLCALQRFYLPSVLTGVCIIIVADENKKTICLQQMSKIIMTPKEEVGMNKSDNE